MRRIMVTVFALAVGVLVIRVVAQPGSAPASSPPDPVKLWQILQAERYQNWGPFPGFPIGFYSGVSPHGALLKLYVNRVVYGSTTVPPEGAILVKDNFTADRKLAAHTLMVRVPGYDPEHKDWWYAKYGPDGKVESAGKVEACRDCHAAAQGGDYIFSNDKGEQPPRR